MTQRNQHRESESGRSAAPTQARPAERAGKAVVKQAKTLRGRQVRAGDAPTGTVRGRYMAIPKQSEPPAGATATSLHERAGQQPRLARSARLEARVTEAQKLLIEEAAELADMTVSAFVLKAAQLYRRTILRRQQSIELSARDQRSLVEALLNPPAPAPVLLAAMRQYRERYTQEGHGL